MKIEKLSKNNGNKKFVYGFVICAALFITVNLLTSKSKFKAEDNIDLAEGTINYTIPDLKLMAVYVKNDEGTFEKKDTVPSDTTYQVVKGEGDNTSYCIDQLTGDKINNAYMKYEDGNIDIKVNKKGTKCWVYLEKAKLLNKEILNQNPPKESTYNATYKHIAEFTSTSTTDEGVFKMPDYDGEPTYYFRGAVKDNYVKFAGFYWRIIRINSDGSIRLIYDGTSAHENGEANEDRQIGRNVFNEERNDAKYVGFMYGGAKGEASNSYEQATTNTTKSDILINLETWYQENLTKYYNYIEKNAIFCNDRRSSVSDKWDKWLETRINYEGFGSNATTYGPAMRQISDSLIYADLSCQPNDRFTSTNAVKGNKAMEYPIGLITLDELIMGGTFGQKINSEYYLYNGQYYWTMSPYNLMNAEGGIAHLYNCCLDGSLGGAWSNTSDRGIRPVINLKANTTFSKGNGTINSPYEIN